MAGYATPAWTNDASPAIDDSALLDIGHGIEIAEHPYGVCSTAAATAAKTVTIDYSGTLTLFTGLTVRVKFTNGNTAASPKLNVNSTGAKSIVYGTSLAAGGGWTAGAVTELTYDGTNWVMSRAAAVDTTPTSGSTSLVTSGAVFDGLQRRVNRNILDNWYFVGGGTGNGVFPVNQRGQTSYTGNGRKFDRWGFGSAGGSMTLLSGGVQVYVTSSSQLFSQNIEEDASALLGMTVTVSLLTSSGVLYTKSGTLPSTRPTQTKNYISQEIPNVGNLVVGWAGGVGCFSCGVVNSSASSTSITIAAMKLEIGNTQTLAHLEGSTWVVNEIPSYADQLAKCQRYLLVFKPITDNYCFISFANGNSSSSNNAVALVPTPVTMRGTPSVTPTGTLVLNDRTQNTQLSVSSFVSAGTRVSANSVTLVPAAVGTVAGRLYEFAIWNDSSAKLVISAEI